MFDGNKCGKCQNHDYEVFKKGHARDCPFKRCECLKCRLLDARSDILQVISGKGTQLKGTKKDPNCGFCQNHGIKILRKGHVRSCGFGQERHFKLENCFDCEVHYIRNEVNRLQIKMRRAMKEDRTLSEEQRRTAREAITRDEVEKVCEMARLARKKREAILSAQQVGEPSALNGQHSSNGHQRNHGHHAAAQLAPSFVELVANCSGGGRRRREQLEMDAPGEQGGEQNERGDDDEDEALCEGAEEDEDEDCEDELRSSLDDGAVDLVRRRRSSLDQQTGGVWRPWSAQQQQQQHEQPRPSHAQLALLIEQQQQHHHHHQLQQQTQHHNHLHSQQVQAHSRHPPSYQQIGTQMPPLLGHFNQQNQLNQLSQPQHIQQQRQQQQPQLLHQRPLQPHPQQQLQIHPQQQQQQQQQHHQLQQQQLFNAILGLFLARFATAETN